MEHDHSDNSPKDLQPEFIPLEPEQCEEVKTVEPSPPQVEVEEVHHDNQNEIYHEEDQSKDHDHKDQCIDEQPIIVDETDIRLPSNSENDEVRADHVQEPEIQSQENLGENLDDDSGDNQEEQGEEDNHVENQQDPNLDNEFYQHSLQYLVQNLNNLRDTLQNILTNSELAQELQLNNQNQLNQNLGENQGMNNVPMNILNNEDHLQDQLLNIRRILAGNIDNLDGNLANDAYNWENILNQHDLLNDQNGQAQNQNVQANRQDTWINKIETRVKEFIAALPKDANTFFLLILALSTILFLFGLTSLPDLHQKNPDYLIDWLASHKDSRLLLLGFGLLYLCLNFKFNHVLYNAFISDPGENTYKTFFATLGKYSPFYDIGLYVFIDATIIGNKLEFCFVSCVLAWYIASTKLVWLLHQKLNQSAVSIHHNTDNNFSKMKKVQFVSAIYLIINLQVAYSIVWLAWYSSYLTLFVLSSLSLLAIIEPLKVFLSSSILVKNYSLVSNNNTRELSDPKFKVELLIDLVNQFIIMLLIIVLGISYARYVTGFVAVYWLSFSNSIEKLKNCYNKYSNWLKLQKRLDETFPVVERLYDAPEELCSICHENLLIARKLPCGHIFHLKCLIYWLENQKTCPNCRANVTNLNEIMGNNAQESTMGRIFNQIVGPFRSLFNRA